MIKKITQRKSIRQFVKFGIIGATAFVVDMAFYALFTRVFHIYHIFAKLMSFFCAAYYSYEMNSRWTFRRGHLRGIKLLTKSYIVQTIGALINASGLYLFFDVLKYNEIAALLIATIAAAIWNFSTNKFWVYRA
ncbi:MAG: hypothetical protein CEN91_316 [Candidatus Berkelbacteria bacterium Licking1014_85]|uniref:GtrA/DPMS transmembrane domain-containing protein n=1 Tax=Candidatus Berkelbacteria bacterium Licking1014_85 TaxID=2017148 RepID=A0A554LJI9_9BACT|nr:MAG: hypothetical protein CEN91_316 [Candidatus Berkelbacteria bacterium Licking1014_85]